MALSIAVLTSTNRKGRVGPKIADWFLEEARKIDGELEFELVDIDELPFFDEPNLPSMQQYETDTLKNWSKTISRYDGFVIVQAEYNHTPPAPIKNALDSLFKEWNRKVVGFVGYGSYGAESSIMFMRAHVSYLNMMPIRESLRITKSHEALDDNSKPKEGYILGNMAKFVDELKWWTKALKSAKN